MAYEPSQAVSTAAQLPKGTAGQVFIQQGATTDTIAAAVSGDAALSGAGVLTVTSGANHTHTAKSMLLGRLNMNAAASATQYYAVFGPQTSSNEGITAEATAKMDAPFAFTLRNVRLWYEADKVFTVKVRKNGTDTDITFTTNATGSTTSATDLTNTVSFAAGDTFNISFTHSGGGNGTLNYRISAEVDATTS